MFAKSSVNRLAIIVVSTAAFGGCHSSGDRVGTDRAPKERREIVVTCPYCGDNDDHSIRKLKKHQGRLECDECERYFVVTEFAPAGGWTGPVCSSHDPEPARPAPVVSSPSPPPPPQLPISAPGPDPNAVAQYEAALGRYNDAVFKRDAFERLKRGADAAPLRTPEQQLFKLFGGIVNEGALMSLQQEVDKAGMAMLAARYRAYGN